jgi:hypothetical protein
VDRHFAFDTRWSLDAPSVAVRDVLIDLEHYPSWWPQVRAVAKLGEDDALLLCRAALPYTLELRLHAVCRDLPTLRVEVSGDLCGEIAWTLAEGPSGGCVVEAHQEVELVRLPAPVVAASRPLLAWNHARMMTGGLAGLRARLAQHAEHQQQLR